MELSNIRYFIMAAQYQNLTKAARLLDISQPTLTKSIAHLEDELGSLLFDRIGKRVRLNECGRKFFADAVIPVQELDKVVTSIKNQPAKPALYLGLFHHSDRFMRCLDEFLKANPDVAFRIDHFNITSRGIDTNEFDMLLYPGSPYFQYYKSRIVFTDPYYLAVNRSDPLTEKEAVSLADLSGRKLILIKHGDNLFDLPYYICANSGLQVNNGIFTNGHEIQRWLVSNNCGVGFVPQDSAESYAADANIALMNIADANLRQDIFIGFKRAKRLSDDGVRFVAFVRDHFSI